MYMSAQRRDPGHTQLSVEECMDMYACPEQGPLGRARHDEWLLPSDEQIAAGKLTISRVT